MEPDSTASADAPSRPGRRSRTRPVGITGGYQPALDGVRAIAVSMVMVFHLARPWMTRGGAGVDMFFVVSGYLITSLLLREQHGSGRIHLGNFYVRRFLRLAPLSIAVVLVVLALSEIGVAGRLGIFTLPATALSIIFYYANWWSISPGSDMGPFGHMWSLSVEEQFYLVWPAVLIATLAILGKRAVPALIVAGTTLVVALGIYRQLLFDAGPDGWSLPAVPGFRYQDIYLGSFLRPDGLVLGCLLALVLARFDVRRALDRLIPWIGFAGLIVACVALIWTRSPVYGFGANLIPPWGLSLFNLGTTLALGWIVLIPTSAFARLLSIAPLRWVGRRSYGIYVLHPLVYRMFDTRWNVSSNLAGIARIVLSLVIAGLSYRYFETPFLRLKERFATRTKAPRPAGASSPDPDS